ncbi:helix-turn-helix domain-containing protein [Chitinophaga filiformis]|uniref:AraC family transcriptional regulator n=1 Tax=Chitinophaga filiformis TaxID=104663 RepID=A0ABY4I8B8_CHIFI|nr:AraC family transcriptional regulator [Chitinophaga filiformis]UPK72117.1 AraC family transcriptional regulator [Chitinophaga filiformis]
MKHVPVHKLRDRSSLGFQLAFFDEQFDYRQSRDLGAHRDDHYIFFIMMDGSGSTIVDFQEKIVGASQLFYILPEQIHYRIRSHKAKGWFIAADPALIDPACRNVIESWSGFQEPITLAPDELKDYDLLLSVLHRQTSMQQQQAGRLSVLHALLRSFFEMAAGTIREHSTVAAHNSRPAMLSMQFKKLLNENIRRYKSPADYADMLHISETYLNESLKKITGSTVSFWIKFAILTEAKRLLYFTHLNVKQIAGELGYDNHSYFSRLFYKETGMTPLTFRKKIKGDDKLLFPL